MTGLAKLAQGIKSVTCVDTLHLSLFISLNRDLVQVIQQARLRAGWSPTIKEALDEFVEEKSREMGDFSVRDIVSSQVAEVAHRVKMNAAMRLEMNAEDEAEARIDQALIEEFDRLNDEEPIAITWHDKTFIFHNWSPRRGGFAVSLECDDCTLHLRIGDPTRRATVLLEIRSTALWRGWSECALAWLNWSKSLGMHCRKEQVKRLDIAVDVQGDHVEAFKNNGRFVCRARNNHPFDLAGMINDLEAIFSQDLSQEEITPLLWKWWNEKIEQDRQAIFACGAHDDASARMKAFHELVNGGAEFWNKNECRMVSWGHRGGKNPYFRVYNKLAELDVGSAEKKALMMEIYKANGLRVGFGVTRIEWELTRSFFREMLVDGQQIQTLQQAIDSFAKLLGYLAGNEDQNGWCTLCENMNKHSKRRTVDPVWQSVQQATEVAHIEREAYEKATLEQREKRALHAMIDFVCCESAYQFHQDISSGKIKEQINERGERIMAHIYDRLQSETMQRLLVSGRCNPNTDIYAQDVDLRIAARMAFHQIGLTSTIEIRSKDQNPTIALAG